MLVLALTASLGLVIGSVRVRGVRFGVAGVLFSGLLFGHFGAAVTTPPVLEFARDFGLVLFVYAIGVEVGPGFAASLRRRGLPLNLIAAGTVIAGAVVAVVISRVAGIAVPVAVGMFSGATTNTPSLGAAQAVLSGMPGYPGAETQLPGLGYAVSYPFGLFGVILSIAVARSAMHGRANSASVPLPAEDPPAPATAGDPPSSPAETVISERPESLQVLPVFVGIALGVLVGSIPVHIAGLPAPLRLGMAGGPLVVAIALGAIGRFGPLDWRMPHAVDATFREVGIVLFLSCVGLRSGSSFVETLLHGGGLRWMAWAALITLIPLVAAALVARGMLRISYPTLCGLLTGSMTNPAALAFAQSLERSPETTQCYATVYPLTMVLRVIAAQLIVLLFMR